MIQSTMGKALNAYGALNRVRSQVKGKTALDLFHLKNMLQESIDFQVEEEQKLIIECGGIVTDAGTIVIADKDKRAAFAKARQELADMACEIKTDPVLMDLEKNPDITMEDIEQLDGFVIFK